MSKSRLSDRRARHDAFHKKAQKAGFRARAVFKLQEIDEAVRLFQRGDRVLDLGCAPGSWLQYARGQVGDGGALVGIDRAPLREGIPGARILVGDVFTVTAAELKGNLAGFDVVLSDMAPDTIGVRYVDQARSEALFERALEIAAEVLVPGGNFVGKLFQGPEFKKLTEAVRARFAVQRTAKPASSRQISIEQYVIGKGFRGAPAGVAPSMPGSPPGGWP
jgi:23S rRNA (uridine2552-2'-O)-methyltransferase